MKRVNDRRLGLALGGGAARSMIHIGALQVLVAEGIHVSAIAGTSAGSIIGAAFAAGAHPEDLEKEAAALTWRSLARPAFSRRGLLGLERLEALIRKIVSVARFEDLSMPLNVVATDLNTGERVVIDEGELVSALLASCAIPESLPDEGLIEELNQALIGKGAFQRFEEALQKYPNRRKQWHNFRAAKVNARAREWLREHGIDPNF